MKLVSIIGDIWLMTRQQDGCFGQTFSPPEMDKQTQNIRAIRGENIEWRGGGRLIANNGVRSLAKAVIEINVRGLPQQNTYTIYHDKKGFFCKVQGTRVNLVDLMGDQK